MIVSSFRMDANEWEIILPLAPWLSPKSYQVKNSKEGQAHGYLLANSCMERDGGKPH